MSSSSADSALAQKIAYGTIRMRTALDHYCGQLGCKKLGRRERILFRMALYQYRYLERIPLFALVDDMVELAKKRIHPSFASYMNVMLRKLPEVAFSLPEGDNLGCLSVRYSYPISFVHLLIEEYGLERTKSILAYGNDDPRYTAIHLKGDSLPGTSVIADTPLPMVVVDDTSVMPQLIASSDYYIQNPTQVTILAELCRTMEKEPQTILDLCAAPGGKSIVLHQLFPNATLTVNDVSSDKIAILQQNLDHYRIPATTTCITGEEYPTDTLFDLVVVDAPCSNTGVLARRAEARWRISDESIASHVALQRQLVAHSKALLAPGGSLIFLTCSILSAENDCAGISGIAKKILPQGDFWDGGYAILGT